MPRLLDALSNRRLRFFEGLHALYRATGDIARSLEFLADRLGSSREGEAARSASRAIAAGQGLTDALRNTGLHLSPVEQGLLEVGEHSGSVEQTLGAIIRELHRARAAVSQLVARLAYPVLVLHFAGFVFTFIQSLQTGFSLVWPLLYFGSLYAPVVAGWWLLRRARSSPSLQTKLLLLPALGPWWKSRMQSRFAFAVGQLYSAGVPIARALAITAEGFAEQAAAGEIRQAAAEVERGARLTEHIPPILDDSLLRDAISIGEQSGALSEELERARAYYEERADQALARIARLAYAVTFSVAALVVFSLAMKLYGGYYAVIR